MAGKILDNFVGKFTDEEHEAYAQFAFNVLLIDMMEKCDEDYYHDEIESIKNKSKELKSNS